MMMNFTRWLIKRSAAVLLCVVFLFAFFVPISARAQSTETEGQELVRVGWYESSFNITGESGRKSGYAYEYQLKIAAYTGWTYEYVKGSWSDLFQMLKDGEIDLMSDVSYTDERAEQMLFPDLPMGTEEYYIFIAPGNKKITADDPATLNGKKIGVNAGSVQVDFYNRWAQKNGVTAEIVELTTEEEVSVRKLARGELDAFITPNVHVDSSKLVPVFKIGYSDFFFVVSKDRPELLGKLNSAMSRIQDENPYYNEQMFRKHVQSFGANAFLSSGEEDWLASHGAIRVGYQDNYLAFCAKDTKTGELVGALKDYLEKASDCFVDAHIDYEAIGYPTVAAALNAMKKGEIDCLFPANFSGYDGEKEHILITPSIMQTDMYAVVRTDDQKLFAEKQRVVVAVNEGNPNYDIFLTEHFPDWRPVYYKTTADCLEAIRDGLADCVLISSYRYNNISRLCEKYRLTTYSTGIALDYCIAVNEGQTELYSILAKTTGLVPASTVSAALSYYVTQDAKRTFVDFLVDNIVVVIIVFSILVVLILFLMIRSMRSERKAKKLISVTENDVLTGLYNRNYFFEYADRMYREQPNVTRDAIVVNIEQFHSINALNGWEFGDEVLRVLGAEIAVIAKENGGIGGRFGADRFDIYCKHVSDYQAIFDRLQTRLDALAQNNASIRLRMGVMPWQAKLEPIQLFDRARTACSMARGHYKEHLIVFDEKVRDRELMDQRLLNDLRRALDNFEFEVYYQPKYDIKGDKPKLVSAEALIRWQHPELGIIPPDNFIPLFERNGKITEVDKYVWEQAARQIARWKAEFGVVIPVSVNLSRIDVFDPTLEETLDEIVSSNGLDYSALKLEVTESAYTENAIQVIKIVEALRDKGYTVEMDDFGTGYSSLNMLSAMPIDVLKMDRTFIMNIENSERDVQLVALILGIADNLHIPVIAEGVETEAQIKILKDLGCTLVQGYYFSRPLLPSEFESKILNEMK